MKILALDTATENCSAALLVDGHLTARERLIERGHAASILTMVDEVLAEARVSARELTAIAFGRGPGSFTGVRLAASVAQGLGYGAGVPLIPVSDLAAVAQRAFASEPAAQRVVVCNDARMREVYWGCFARGADGLIVASGSERVGDPSQVALPADWLPASATYGAGTGICAYPRLREILPAGLPVIGDLYPRAAEIALLAVAEAKAGRVVDPEQALPVYLRDDVVQSPAGSH